MSGVDDSLIRLYRLWVRAAAELYGLYVENGRIKRPGKAERAQIIATRYKLDEARKRYYAKCRRRGVKPQGLPHDPEAYVRDLG